MPALLNKWWAAKVVRGRGQGHALGYPTANVMAPGGWQCTYGIYAAVVKAGRKKFRSVLYWGTRGGPPAGGGESLEVHLLDFAGDLYGKTIYFQVGEFIRPDRAIQSRRELKATISSDIAQVKKLSKINL